MYCKYHHKRKTNQSCNLSYLPGMVFLDAAYTLTLNNKNECFFQFHYALLLQNVTWVVGLPGLLKSKSQCKRAEDKKREKNGKKFCQNTIESFCRLELRSKRKLIVNQYFSVTGGNVPYMLMGRLESN